MCKLPCCAASYPVSCLVGQDGGYIPRILFLDSAGTVQPSLTNPQGNPKYKYYYSSASQVVTGMSSAAAHFSAAQHLGANGDEL